MLDIKFIIPLALLLLSSYVSHSGYAGSYPENGCGEQYEEFCGTSAMGLSLCPARDDKERRLMTLVCYLKADEPKNETKIIANVRSVSTNLWNKLWNLVIKTASTTRNFFMAIIHGIGRFCFCILNTLYCIVYILLSVVKGIILSILWAITKILSTIWHAIDFVLRPIFSTIWYGVKSIFQLTFTIWRKIVGEVTLPNHYNVPCQRLTPENECYGEKGYTIKVQKYAKKLWNNEEETICTMGIGCGPSHTYVCPSECIEVIKDCLCGLIQTLCKCMWEFLLGILSALSNLLMWKDPPRSLACVIYDFLEDIYNLFYNLFSSLINAFKNAWKAFKLYLKKHRCKRQDSAIKKFMKSLCLKMKRCIDNAYNFMKKMSPCEPPRRNYYCYD